MSKNMLDNIIVKHYAGSIAYGTNTPLSDVDFRGIFMAPKEFILSPFVNVGEASDSKEEDTKFYELNKFMKLNIDANPNILETLWVDDEHIVESTEMYQHLRSYNHQLLSNKIAYTYSGYAYNQLHRMQNHHGWMDKERIAERRLNEIFDEYPYQNTINWMEETFPDYLVQRINTTRGKNIFVKMCIDFEKFMRDNSLQLVSSKPLKQYHFVKLVHNYLPEKLLDRDFNILKFKHDYELIPYGENIFGVVPAPNSQTINDDGSIHKIDTDNRSIEEIKRAPILIVKFNKKEYDENSNNRKSYHKWKENRNDARKVLESSHGYDCYLDSKTEFLTIDGFKKYDEIKDGDLLGTMNPNTKCIEFQPFSERVKKPFSGTMYHGETQNTAFTVTGNHRMFISNVRRSKGTKYKPELSDWRYSSLDDMMKANQSYYHVFSTVGNDNEEYPVSDDFLKLIGCYLSEGSFLRHNGKPKGISISQLENGRLCKFIDSITEYNFKKYSYNRNGRNELTYNLYDTKFANEILELCGEFEATKKMPKFITSLSKRQANLLLDTMISGDGTHRKESDIYYTSSIDVTNGVQILALMAGKLTKIWDYLDKHGMNQIYTSNKNEPSVLRTSAHIKPIMVNSDNIVCFTVPNENLITRNNGKMAVQGNTKHAMHVVRLLRTAKEALLTGVINVKRPDAEELLAIRNGAWTYEEMMKYFESESKLVMNLGKTSKVLPSSPNRKLATQLVLDLREMHWKQGK